MPRVLPTIIFVLVAAASAITLGIGTYTAPPTIFRPFELLASLAVGTCLFISYMAIFQFRRSGWRVTGPLLLAIGFTLFGIRGMLLRADALIVLNAGSPDSILLGLQNGSVLPALATLLVVTTPLVAAFALGTRHLGSLAYTTEFSAYRSSDTALRVKSEGFAAGDHRSHHIPTEREATGATTAPTGLVGIESVAIKAAGRVQMMAEPDEPAHLSTEEEVNFLRAALKHGLVPEPHGNPIPPAFDKVECSVFAPPTIELHQTFLIQIFLHGIDDILAVAKRALEYDAKANRRARSALRVGIKVGDKIDVMIECPALAFDNPIGSTVWTGPLSRLAFNARLLTGSPAVVVRPIAHVFVNGVPVGEVEFTFHVVEAQFRAPSNAATFGVVSRPELEQLPGPKILDTTATTFRSAFISYARKDFQQTSLFAQGLKERAIRLAVDVTSLEPGDDWAKRLPEMINDCDVFYLMWSDFAAASKWVDIESRLAVATSASRNPKNRPQIRPIVLHQPVAPPPEHLAHCHFNSMWLAHRTAQEIGLFHPEEVQGWRSWFSWLVPRRGARRAT